VPAEPERRYIETGKVTQNGTTRCSPEGAGKWFARKSEVNGRYWGVRYPEKGQKRGGGHGRGDTIPTKGMKKRRQDGPFQVEENKIPGSHGGP